MICVLYLIALKEGMMDGHIQSCLQLIHNFYLGNLKLMKGLFLWLGRCKGTWWRNSAGNSKAKAQLKPIAFGCCCKKCHEYVNVCIYQKLFFSTDPTNQLCLNCTRVERWQALWFLLTGGSSRFLPSTSNGGHCESFGMELCIHFGIWRELWRKRSRVLHANFQRGR